MNSQLHILLVDDNPEDRALVIRELRRDFPKLKINLTWSLPITSCGGRTAWPCSGPSKPAGPNARLSCSPAPAARRWRSSP